MILHEKLKDWRIVLGSGSPRRYELLKGLDIPFTVEYNPNIEEVIDPTLPPKEVPIALAKQKSMAFLRPLAPDELLITADTLVFCRGQILGKPQSREEAIAMLQLLSAEKHTVWTGVYLSTLQSTHSFTAATEVTFSKLSDEKIVYYVDKYKPFDKAGAYGAQDWIGYVGIEHINGSYFNVMGLPVQMLCEELGRFVR
ncbi:MAG: Maf family nucleotide pyrophosphatase [Prevotellaceae bacterium]|jgi:septum formation protein|nr:Maf family nucleotide pyrophosphatase [Prevotellaceae bacterium]